MNGFERELNNRIRRWSHGEIEAVNCCTNWREALRKSAEGAALPPPRRISILPAPWANLRAIQVKGVDPKQEQQRARYRHLCKITPGIISASGRAADHYR